MSRRAAILGLGTRGVIWAETCHAAGWLVTGFDPEPGTASQLAALTDWKREHMISSAVRGADLVLRCLPDRLELVQMVIQRAQAEAPENALVVVHTNAFDVEAAQSCALRPGQVFCLTQPDDGDVSLGVSERNGPDVRREAAQAIAEFAAVLSLDMASPDGFQDSAESA